MLTEQDWRISGTRVIRFCHLIDASTSNPLLFNSVKFSDRSVFEYTVISLSPEGKLQEEMRSLGVESFSVNCMSRKQYPATVAKLVGKLMRGKFEVVQVHSFEASLVGLIAANLARIPVRIFSGHHSHEVPLYDSPRLLLADSFLARRLATHVIAPSKNMRDIFVAKHKVPPARIEVLHHGLDLSGWRKQAEQPSGLKDELGFENKLLFGAVGRLFWVKSFDTLITAFAAAAREDDQIALAIAGDGTDRSQLEELIDELGMLERIKLIGKRKDIAAVMNEFDVLIHPSIAESFGLIYTEAFALGKPVIATRGGVSEEMIRDGENGFLINARDVSEMRAAIAKMTELKEKWKLMGAAGRAVSESFSVEITQSACDRFVSSLVQR